MSSNPPLPRRSLVYLSGPPGVGKSTLTRELTRHCQRTTLLKPFARDILALPTNPAARLELAAAVELGRRRDRFSGTDALPMNVITAAEQWMAGDGRAYGLVLAEGDRLANHRFLSGSAAAGWDVTLLHLDAPGPLLDERCAARGSHQAVTWRNGRATKARNLADRMEGERTAAVVRLDGRQTVDQVAAAARTAAPVLNVLYPTERKGGPSDD